ncbi:N utilization substance protein B [Metamycoplasma subdolum]|uniref:N utilization substance protein B n=1 Tax=Metamycoplasma subdolum TaxID=92407 RepID=A0A3M0A235_9BACT|nr:transcription antitermination factor NusB [Metamycoplasma subdolum]RMA78494.1 N utilization substance protein B [Metamycoplasma subdolum]WPB50426.1 transcription antitermination factor NusB [Metamycoplasma subdolum]
MEKKQIKDDFFNEDNEDFKLTEEEENKLAFIIRRYEKRTKFIFWIYQSELLEESLNASKLFDEVFLDQREYFAVKKIEKNYPIYKKLISSVLNPGWTYERVQPLLRAIMIYGIFEFSFNKKNVVINEMINITKIFVPGIYYKFLNKILDLISRILESKTYENKN